MDYSHSLFSNDFRLNTPALLAVVQNVCFKVLMRKTGVVFTGEPRVGKTSCCEALVDEIPKRFPSVYVFMIPAVSVDSSGERYSSIIHQMLDLEEIKPGSRVTFIQRQSLLIERLLIRAAQAKARQIVMLIDELQRLSAADFNQLADVYNKLRAKKVTLTVISFAMPSIDKKVVQFLDDDARHIIGRFLSDIRPMYGVTSLTQLTSILKLYDEPSSYCGSEICYSSNILPKAYACGFRVSSLSENIWLEMSRIATGKYVNNLPMEHITQVILYLFVILSQGDKCGLAVPPDLIVEAIHESNFKAFCRSTGSKYGGK
ncbi:ATP-binding protein [Ectopseudomonas chengduensis]|jgi:nucleoside-triphosphatase THEP1|nr:ATP-binding protein [Pseudomonas chengduensis]WKC36742.1 ATP-binding protein [Pseudomonas chengduensis]